MLAASLGGQGYGQTAARPEVEFSWKITIRLEILFTIENLSSSCVGGVGRWDDLFSPLHPAASSLLVHEQILLKANISDKRGENKHPNRTSFHRCEQWHSRRSICCQTQVDWALRWRYSNCDSPFLRLLHLCLPSLCGDVLSRARLPFCCIVCVLSAISSLTFQKTW